MTDPTERVAEAIRQRDTTFESVRYTTSYYTALAQAAIDAHNKALALNKKQRRLDRLRRKHARRRGVLG